MIGPVSRRSLVAVLAALALGATAGAASGAPTRAGMATCDYNGPVWTLTDGRKGTIWVAEFQKTTCAFSTTWARKLALLNTPKQYGVPLPGGPTGWRCQSLATSTKKVLSGSCVNGTKFFQWHPGV